MGQRFGFILGLAVFHIGFAQTTLNAQNAQKNELEDPQALIQKAADAEKAKRGEMDRVKRDAERVVARRARARRGRFGVNQAIGRALANPFAAPIPQQRWMQQRGNARAGAFAGNAAGFPPGFFPQGNLFWGAAPGGFPVGGFWNGPGQVQTFMSPDGRFAGAFVRFGF